MQDEDDCGAFAAAAVGSKPYLRPGILGKELTMRAAVQVITLGGCRSPPPTPVPRIEAALAPYGRELHFY